MTTVQGSVFAPVSTPGWVPPVVSAAKQIYEFYTPLIFDGLEFWTFIHGVWKRVSREEMSNIIPSSNLSRAPEGRINRGFSDKVFSELLGMVEIAPNPWPLQPGPQLVNCANGMVNVLTGIVTPHWGGSYSRVQVPVLYDPEAVCPLWMEFLEDCLGKRDDLKTWLQRFFGSCLLPHHHPGRFLYLWGPGASGKSTATQVLRNVLGGTNCGSVSFGSLPDRFHVGFLRDKLMNVCCADGFPGQFSEASSAVLMRMLSGKSVLGAIKHGDNFGFNSTAKFIVESNEPPHQMPSSLARAMLVMPFKHTVPEKRRDPFMLNKLELEIAGIFRWMVDGARDVLREGF